MGQSDNNSLYMGELVPEDEKLIGPIVKGLKDKVNEQNAVGPKTISSKMKIVGYDISQEKLKQVMHVIRVRGLVKCLIDGPNGYYITAGLKEWTRYSLLMKGKIHRLEIEHKALSEQFKEYHSPRLFP